VSSASSYHRVFSLALVTVLIALAGCDRGSHPQLIGRAAPDFTVSDAQRTVSLHDYKGKVVVLNFWATWCAPCIEELPSLMQMQHDLGDKVTVLAIATDHDPAAYQRFVRTRHVDLLTVNDAAETSSSEYGTWIWPETYIIDKKGTIRRKFIGPVEWTNAAIVSYLEKLQTES
jgi:cytochrome c biogenesis protein CcmG/thiol:disulfide interchange protein DsbE